MIVRNFLGHSVEVPVHKVERELQDVIAAVDEACGASTTEPEIERLRRARLEWLKAVNREAVT